MSCFLSGLLFTTRLLFVRALQRESWLNHSLSLHFFDRRIHPSSEYSPMILLSPNSLHEKEDKMVFWFHHPSNPSSLLTWKCPCRQDPSRWKGSCPAGSRAWRWKAVTARQALSWLRRVSLGVAETVHWSDFICTPCFSFSCHVQMVFFLKFNWYSYFPTLIRRWSLEFHFF